MTTQPEALDLADWLESVSTGLSANKAAAELRRLHAENEALRAERNRNLDSIQVGNNIIQSLKDENEALRAALERPVAEVPKERVREIFMNHGFTIKGGQTDLKPYVYNAAYALLNAAPKPAQQAEADKLLRQVLYVIEAWERDCDHGDYWRDRDDAIAAIRKHLGETT